MMVEKYFPVAVGRLRLYFDVCFLVHEFILSYLELDDKKTLNGLKTSTDK